jgi:hypothetical protein
MDTGMLQVKTWMAKPSDASIPPAVMLQRKCACGQRMVTGDGCSTCRWQGRGLQRFPSPQTQTAPPVRPIVQEVLRTLGRPLDSDVSSFVGSRFDQASQVEEVARQGDPKSDGFVFWNVGVGSANLRQTHKDRLRKDIIPRWKQLLTSNPNLRIKVNGSASSGGGRTWISSGRPADRPSVPEVSRGTGLLAGINPAAAASLVTCRFMTRRMDRPLHPGVCRPSVSK